jgi:[ribosomal protein S18]-alanine N-acetyltransferase
VQILIAGQEHAELLAALHDTCFADQKNTQGRNNPSESWSAASITRLLALPGAFALIGCGPADSARLSKNTRSKNMSGENTPLGFILCILSGEVSEIVAIGTLPAFRRRGLADTLLSAAQTMAREAGFDGLLLEVAEDNKPAIALYDSFGFQVLGIRKNYYLRESGRINAIQMRLILSP